MLYFPAGSPSLSLTMSVDCWHDHRQKDFPHYRIIRKSALEIENLAEKAYIPNATNSKALVLSQESAARTSFLSKLWVVHWFLCFFLLPKILNRRFPLELQSMQRYKEKEKLHISYEVYIYHISYISYIYHTKFWLEHLQILILFLHWLSPPHPTRTQTKKFWAPGRMAHGSFDGYRIISISTGTLSAGTVTSFK